MFYNAKLKLYYRHCRVIDNTDKLRFNTFIYKMFLLSLQAPDAVSLDKNLVSERFGTHYSPCDAVVVHFFLKDIAT